MANEPNVLTSTERGATVKTTYVERQVKAFAVFDHEVEVLSSLNTQSTVFFAVGSAAVSYAIGIWTNAGFAQQLTPAGELASTLIAPGLLVVAIVFYGLALSAWWKRRKRLHEIMQHSISVTK
jgi:hypothetical protein